MACEVLCCEVNALIDVVVEGRGGAYLDTLFSVVTRGAPSPDRLAGYFEFNRAAMEFAFQSLHLASPRVEP